MYFNGLCRQGAIDTQTHKHTNSLSLANCWQFFGLFFLWDLRVCVALQHLDRSLRRPINDSNLSEWVWHPRLCLYVSTTWWINTSARDEPTSHAAGLAATEACGVQPIYWVTVWPWDNDGQFNGPPTGAHSSHAAFMRIINVSSSLFFALPKTLRWGVKLKSAAMKHREYQDASVPERFTLQPFSVAAF